MTLWFPCPIAFLFLRSQAFFFSPTCSPGCRQMNSKWPMWGWTLWKQTTKIRYLLSSLFHLLAPWIQFIHGNETHILSLEQDPAATSLPPPNFFFFLLFLFPLLPSFLFLISYFSLYKRDLVLPYLLLWKSGCPLKHIISRLSIDLNDYFFFFSRIVLETGSFEKMHVRICTGSMICFANNHWVSREREKTSFEIFNVKKIL